MKTLQTLFPIHWLISMMLRAKISLFKVKKKSLWKKFWAFLNQPLPREKVQLSSQIHSFVWISLTMSKNSLLVLPMIRISDALLNTLNHKNQIWLKIDLITLRAIICHIHQRVLRTLIKTWELEKKILCSQLSQTIKWLLSIEGNKQRDFNNIS